jgi:type I restriction enzyme S subunit
MSKDKARTACKKVAFGDVVHHIKDRVTDVMSCGLTEYIRGEHFQPGHLQLIDRSTLGDGKHGSAFNTRFRKGDVLYVSRNPQLRKAAIADFDGICANTTYVLRSNPKALLQDLLPFIMQTESFVEHSIEHKRGSTNFYVNFSDISSYEFHLPPLEEQRRMAEVLSAIETFRQKLLTVAHSTEVVLSSLRETCFGISTGTTSTLGKLCGKGSGIRIGPFGAQIHRSDYVSEGIPVVMPSDLSDGLISASKIAKVSIAKAEELNQHRLRVGDIVLPRRGALDRRALVNEEQEGWLCGTGSLRIRLDDMSLVDAVVQSLSSASVLSWLDSRAVGTTMKNLNSTIIADLPVRIPTNAGSILEVIDQLIKSRRLIYLQLTNLETVSSIRFM